MNYGMLNLASVALGLAGWAIPVIHIGLRAKNAGGTGHFAPVLSMGACTLAIWFQMCYNEHLVNIQDWSALMDTSAAVRGISLFLLVSTLLLNLLLVWAERTFSSTEAKS